MKDAITELTRIVQEVSLVSTPVDQVKVIVDQISESLGSDVCSLYRIEADGSLVLLATHGLEANRPVQIPAGKGLVGQVVKLRHILNLANGLRHPEYFHVKDVLEESFKSFCGVPLVSNGAVIGVLVVQSRRAKALSEKQAAFLSTLAAHIALIVQHLPSALGVKSAADVRLLGVPASPGISMGQVRVCQKLNLADLKLRQRALEPDSEKRWQALLNRVGAELEAEQKTLGELASSEIANMFDAYKMLLFDPILGERVKTAMVEGYDLPSALKLAIQHFAELFQKMDDDYLRARHEDVWHLGNKLYQSYVAQSQQAGTVAIRPDAEADDIILLGRDISVSDVANISPCALRGIVCVEGSRLSHTSILANALGIPAVMGVQGALSADDGDHIIVDGGEGSVIIKPSAPVAREYQSLIDKARMFESELSRFKDSPAVTRSGTRIQLMTNSGLLADITPGLKVGAEGVGLFRTEIPFLMSETFPSEEAQASLYAKVLKRFEGKPVYMRTLDIGGDKQLPYFRIAGEDNPALGWRGIRFSLDNVQLLMTQLRAMLKAAQGQDNLHVLIPMVSAKDELVQFRQILHDAYSQLLEEGLAVSWPKVGVMIEVPAAISQIPFWREELDFVSIGSNDLSQYLLAVDRTNARVAKRYDHVHPAVIHEVERAVIAAQKANLPLCVCGEMASDPVSVMLLLAMGVTKLSMSSSRLPRVKLLITNLSDELAKDFLDEVRSMDNALAIRSRGLALIAQHQLDQLPEAETK